jgi:tellurite methyltransferase
VDASPAGIERVRRAARDERLPVEAIEADVETYPIGARYDTVLAIGLLMFFDRATALRLLASVQEAVRPGGVAFVTVLIEGTTFRAVFDPQRHHLFGATELRNAFKGWEILESVAGTFDAPGGTKKVFSTVAARKPA